MATYKELHYANKDRIKKDMPASTKPEARVEYEEVNNLDSIQSLKSRLQTLGRDVDATLKAYAAARFILICQLETCQAEQMLIVTRKRDIELLKSKKKHKGYRLKKMQLLHGLRDRIKSYSISCMQLSVKVQKFEKIKSKLELEQKEYQNISNMIEHLCQSK